jgi:hypothetical protein
MFARKFAVNVYHTNCMASMRWSTACEFGSLATLTTRISPHNFRGNSLPRRNCCTRTLGLTWHRVLLLLLLLLLLLATTTTAVLRLLRRRSKK